MEFARGPFDILRVIVHVGGPKKRERTFRSGVHAQGHGALATLFSRRPQQCAARGPALCGFVVICASARLLSDSKEG
jgi:hypothetical protein